MKDKEIAAEIQTLFPRHTRQLYSATLHSDETGVILRPEAQEIVNRLKPVKSPVKDFHKKKHSFKVRVTESRYNEVKRLIEEDGRFASVQDWLSWWVYVWVSQKEKAAPAVGATETARETMSDGIIDEEG